MAKKELLEKVRKQMVFEVESAYLYYGMAAWLTNNQWEGFAHFMKHQAKEELEHAEKFYGFLAEVGCDISFDSLKAPETEYKDVLSLFKAALEHEKVVTSNIHKLFEEATDEKNYPVLEMLHWFVKEQVEEEATFEGIIHTLEGINGQFSGLYLFDKELGRRE